MLLRKAQSLHDVANLLGVQPAHLAYVLYKKPAVLKYQVFSIPKKFGGVRTIHAPIADLKLIQSRLAALLLACSDELTEKYGRKAVHGFASGRSILTNAHSHRGRVHVFNLDLSDFFGSFNFGRVRGYFIRDSDFSLDPSVATVIAQIACHNNALPQGGPTSPVITNLIGNILDRRVARLAQRAKCVYTRYADDLTFSTNLSEFPQDIAVLDSGEWRVGEKLQRLITTSGFVVNASKVRMQYADSRQLVTGLVVNQKANVPSDYRASLRAMAHRLFRRGHFHHEFWTTNPATGVRVLNSTLGTEAQLQGMFAHVEHVDRFNCQVRDKTETDAPGRKQLYQRLFHFVQFFAAPTPVILCEGKTDNVYLLHAIRARAALFPELASVDTKSGAVSLNLRLYKYLNKSAGRVLQLSGGQGELGKFIARYVADIRRYFKAAASSQYPVIILVDHDSGGKQVYGAAIKVVKKPLEMNKAFEHLTGNLYLVCTPLVGGATESCIEDCFDPATLAIELSGKKFNYKNQAIDESSEYGKAYFAQHVVKPNASTIDFSGFDELLDRVRQVLNHYAALPK